MELYCSWRASVAMSKKRATRKGLPRDSRRVERGDLDRNREKAREWGGGKG